MFEIFSRKNKCIGIDIGTTGIKIVELRKENNLPVFVNYAISRDTGSLLQSSDLELLDGQIRDSVGIVLKEGKFTTKRAVLGIPGFLSLISFLELPEMQKSEIEKAVRFEAAKYIPTPINDVSLGWEIIGGSQDKLLEGGQPANRSRKIEIMAVTVPKNAVSKYESVARELKLNLVAMEVESFAIVRALIGNDKGSFLVVNMGSRSTDFIIASDSVVRITRSIDVGGAEISRSIASGMGIDFQRAEMVKRSGKINLIDPQGEATNLIRPVVGMIIDEIRRLQEMFHKKFPLKKIERAIFTGGGSKMKTLIDFFQKETGIECVSGNPLARIGIEKKHQNVLEDAAPELTVSIGLAMRGLLDK